MFFQVSTPVVLGESYLNRRDVRDPALHAESQNIFIIFLSSGSIHILSGSGSILSGFIGSCSFLQDGWKMIVKNGRKPNLLLGTTVSSSQQEK